MSGKLQNMKNNVHANNHFAGLPRMEALVRIANIPIVETGVKTAGLVYSNIKQRNGLFTWSLNTAEGVIIAAVETVRPAVNLIEGPLHRIDKLLCTSLDMVEQRVPSVYLPPQMVEPVLKRAGSVKQLGSAVLENPFSEYAVDRIDGAIDVADKYIERYLPSEDQLDSAISEDDNESKAIHTFHKGQRFSRKLKRRLTQRTILEARALKKQSKEAIHILIYVAELVTTDPKLAIEKARELWAHLSNDEPENQARPQTIEELIVLITRESARRVVHLVNYTGNTASKLPITVRDLLHHFTYAANSLIRTAHLDKAKASAINETLALVAKFTFVYDFLQIYSSNALVRHESEERLAYILAGRMDSNGKPATSPPKKASKHRNATNSRNNNPSIVNSPNGAY